LVRDVEVTAERLQPHAMAAARFPPVELLADESDLLPEAAHRARGALRRNLDDRSDDLEHAAVEINRAAGGQLRRLRAALQQRAINERGRRAPIVFGDDFLFVDEDFELGL